MNKKYYCEFCYQKEAKKFIELKTMNFGNFKIGKYICDICVKKAENE